MSFYQTVLISLAGFHAVAYIGICECKLHGHEPSVCVFSQTVLISFTGFHEVAYTGICECKLHGHEPRV